jgi:uncharacterized small protein (DUF1192 family)
MPSNSAEYMREYRARKKAAHEDYDAAKPTIGRIKSECHDRIAELEAEVARLKRELAARTTVGPAFNSRPFTPVPKR